jgi:hypothetical protein
MASRAISLAYLSSETASFLANVFIFSLVISGVSVRYVALISEMNRCFCSLYLAGTISSTWLRETALAVPSSKRSFKRLRMSLAIL